MDNHGISQGQAVAAILGSLSVFLLVKRLRGFIAASIRADNALPPWKDHASFHLVTNMTQTIQHEPTILRRKQVEARTGLSRSTIYQYIKDGAFPKPVPLGPRAVGWLESEVSEWIAERVRIGREGSWQPA